MVMLVRVTMQTHVKGIHGRWQGQLRKVTAAKVMVKVAVNYTRSTIKKFKIYFQPIDGERSI